MDCENVNADDVGIHLVIKKIRELTISNRDNIRVNVSLQSSKYPLPIPY